MLFRNKRAFKETFLEYYTPLCNYAANNLKNTGHAEDIIQEVFLNLWEKNDSIELTGTLEQYLFKSVKNKILEFIRKHQNYERHKASSIEQLLETQNIAEVSDTYMKLELLNNSLRHLPPKCKNVFVLNKFKGLTYAEIAEVQKISVKTVENHMLKALQILRSHLKQY
ncbi:MAG: RNA polymerase sigma-70 factor [Bacteroidia bacterium]|nr:RNA polymerase sigma-70 factor [Bacteroidia bacterium]